MRKGCFAGSYAEARASFRDLGAAAGAKLTSFALAGWTGLAGEDLTTDVAWLGPTSPQGVLILTSGTHGVEGYAGSGFQCALLAGVRRLKLPERVAVILVHALNPFGFSQGHRVDERNVDLNRNFIDFTRPLPESPDYGALHEAIVPSAWTGAARARADEMIARAWRSLGERGFQEALCRGQHAHPDGLFYGGESPSWSHRTWRTILGNLPPSIRIMAHVDVHTGLGPSGYGEILYTLPADHPALDLAMHWYRDLGFVAAGSRESAATEVRGTMNHAVVDAGVLAEAASISIEFGTVELRRMFEALRADNWHRVKTKSVPAEIRQELLRCFYPPDSDWCASVLERCERVFASTLEGVAERLRE